MKENADAVVKSAARCRIEVSVIYNCQVINA